MGVERKEPGSERYSREQGIRKKERDRTQPSKNEVVTCECGGVRNRSRLRKFTWLLARWRRKRKWCREDEGERAQPQPRR